MYFIYGIVIFLGLLWLLYSITDTIIKHRKRCITIVMKGKYNLPKGEIIQIGPRSKAKIQSSIYKDGNTILKVIKL